MNGVVTFVRFITYSVAGLAIRKGWNWLTADVDPIPGTKEFNKELNNGLSKDDKKLLKNKLTHHHTEGDVISTALTGRGTIGRVKKIKSDDVNPLKKHSLTNWTDSEPDHEPHTEAEMMGE